MLQNTRKSLSDKISEVILKQNQNQSLSSSGESDKEDAPPKVVDFDEYEQDQNVPKTSYIRNRVRNVKLLSEQSERYRGEIASRKEIESFEDPETDGERNSSNNESEIAESKEDENSSVGEDSNSSDEANSEDQYEAESSENESGNDETTLIAEKNQDAEVRKGKCVKNQLIIWEKLLETRIHSQKVLNKSNLMPPPNKLRKLISENKEFADELQKTAGSTGFLLSRLLELQNLLKKQFSEFKESRKRSPSPSSNDDCPEKKMEIEIANNFSSFKQCRNSILLKWDDRTRLLTSGVAAKRKAMDEEYNVVHKIDNTLLNLSSLIEKSRTMKGNQNKTSEDENDEAMSECKKQNPNIYDDTDFYHQQLRELIEFKSLSSSNATEVAKQSAELQKLRKRMKKKIDTRSSKGRKVRYNVHNKLINFMAPHDVSSWTDESKDELYKSLFAL